MTAGKAGFENPKRLLGTPGTGAVRLGTATRTLGLAEGIESALAATLLHGFPVWAVLGNERFGMVAIPRHVERLVILADNDAGGKRAAELAVAGQDHGGRTIEVMWPPAGHNDWADVWEAAFGKPGHFNADRSVCKVRLPSLGIERHLTRATASAYYLKSTLVL